MENFRDIWTYLSASPLLHLTLTLAAYQIGIGLYRSGRGNPIVNPVLVAVVLVVGVLLATGTDYATYFDGAQFVHFLLGPATVALAVPLYRQFDKLRRSTLAVLASVLTGSITAVLTALAIGYSLDASRDALLALAPKSVTTPVAMGITEQLGGLPSLTAVLVILTGIIGAMLGPPLLNALRIRSGPARGLALGTASHGIGTARALHLDEAAGAFSGLAMGLNAIATALLLPLVWQLVT